MKFIEHLERLFSVKMSLMKDIFSLVVLEARLAKLRLPSLITCLVLTLPLLFTIWFLTMGILVYFLLPLTHNQLLMDVLIILFLNIALLGMIVLKIKQIYKLMCFDKARHALTLI